MRLVVTTGAPAGRALEIERRLVVGRDEGCDLVLEDDEKASRRHCAFSPNPEFRERVRASAARVLASQSS